MTEPIEGGLTCDEVRDLAAPFVLGALDADEMDAVRRHLGSCAEPHPEFAELGSVVPVLAASVPTVEPPASLKGRLMAAAAADLDAREARTARVPEPVASVAASSAAGGGVAVPAQRTPSPVQVLPRRGSSAGAWLMRIAAVLAIVVLGGWNLLLQGQLAQAQSYEDSVAAVIEVAGQEGSLTAVLTPQGAGGPSGLAAVSASGAVTLAMQDLPATSGDQVYEAWVIGSDSVPVPLGGFEVGSAGTAFFSSDGLPTEPGIVLAVTLEPAPGATAPTTPPVSVGTATAAS